MTQADPGNESAMMSSHDDHIPDWPSEPEPPDRPEPDADRKKKHPGLDRLPTRDVPEPPNRDEIRPEGDGTPDTNTFEPPE